MPRLALLPLTFALLGGCVSDETGPSFGTRSLEGGLLLLEEAGPPVLHQLDLAAPELTPAHAFASQSFAYDLAMSPAGDSLALSWTPPPDGTGVGFDRSLIASVPVADDGTLGAPEWAACLNVPGVWCFYPTWSADGAHLWMVGQGFVPDAAHALYRVPWPPAGAEPTLVVPWATEPAVAPGGDALAWIEVDPEDGSRSMMLGGPHAEDARSLIDAERLDAGDYEFVDIGRPVFDGRGRGLYFIGVLPNSEMAGGLGARLASFFIGSAQAHQNHDLPADWWWVSRDGGEPVRVSWEQTLIYEGRLAPDGRGLVSVTREGLTWLDPSSGEAELIEAHRGLRGLSVVQPQEREGI